MIKTQDDINENKTVKNMTSSEVKTSKVETKENNDLTLEILAILFLTGCFGYGFFIVLKRYFWKENSERGRIEYEVS